MAATPTDTDLRRYYAQRAPQYERIYDKPERQADLRAMQGVVAQTFVNRRVLEVACGTGWWTAHGAAHAAHWLGTDINAQTLALARAKAWPVGKVRFAELDAYALDTLATSGEAPFDGALAAFWWSHVPLVRLGPWLAQWHAVLGPGARVLVLDNRFVRGNSTPLSRTDAQGNTYQQRALDDGSVHEVLKNYPQRDAALALLGERARQPQWQEFEYYWLLTYTLA